MPFESAIGKTDSEETDVTALTGIKNMWVPDIKAFISSFIKEKENVNQQNFDLYLMILKYSILNRIADNFLPLYINFLRSFIVVTPLDILVPLCC